MATVLSGFLPKDGNPGVRLDKLFDVLRPFL
jgi:hypothetical protein